MRPEFQLIDQIQTRLPAPSARVHVGIGDDAAIVQSPSGQTVATVDMMVEGVHFDWAFCSPEDVGYKALAVNISDIAAMGATPLYALISLAVPPSFTESHILEFYDGVRAAAETYRIDVIGGNLSTSPQGFVVDVTLIGEVARPCLRSGLKPGDYLAVTGPLGASALGLSLLQQHGRQAKNLAPQSVARYLRPEPRLAQAHQLIQTGCVHALIDISDGLSSECHHLAQASKQNLVIWQNSLPQPSDWARAQTHATTPLNDFILHGGGDYELLIGLNARAWEDAVIHDLSLRDQVHLIGEVLGPAESPEVWLELDGLRTPLAAKGWDHFQHD